MGESEITETRESYHDIGICLIALDNKVTDLLRKTVAYRLANDYSTLSGHLKDISGVTPDDFVSVQILKLVIDLPYSVQKLSTTDYSDMFHKAFKEMIHRFPTEERFLENVGLATLTNEILSFLHRNLTARRNFVMVMIEHFILDVQCNTATLNNLLGKVKVGIEWKPKSQCLDEHGYWRPQHFCCKGTVGCKHRHTRREKDKGPWDWVNEMKYIRNQVVHSDFKFLGNQGDHEFLQKYRSFINNAVKFADLFPLNPNGTRDEYLNIIDVHKVVKGEVGRLKGEVGRLEGEVGRWKDEVERLSDGNSEWRIENHEKEHDLIEHLRNLMAQTTESDKWAKNKRKPAKKRDG